MNWYAILVVIISILIILNLILLTIMMVLLVKITKKLKNVSAVASDTASSLQGIVNDVKGYAGPIAMGKLAINLFTQATKFSKNKKKKK